MTLSDQCHSVISDAQVSESFRDQSLVKVRVAQGSVTLSDQSHSVVSDAKGLESFRGR